MIDVALVCVCVWGQECVGRRLADKTKLEWNTESSVWIIDRPLHVNTYTHAVQCKVQKCHTIGGFLKATWSVNISLITSHISSWVFHSWRCHICLSVPFFTFYLVFHSFLYLFPTLHTTQIHRHHSADIRRWLLQWINVAVCACLFYILWKRGSVCVCVTYAGSSERH